MDLPNAVKIEVVERGGRKLFLTPVGLSSGGQADASGELHVTLLADTFTSHDTVGRLVDTPYVHYRHGSPIGTGTLGYLFGQSDGYYVAPDFGPASRASPHWLHASDFEAGDALVFLCLPHC